MTARSAGQRREPPSHRPHRCPRGRSAASRPSDRSQTIPAACRNRSVRRGLAAQCRAPTLRATAPVTRRSMGGTEARLQRLWSNEAHIMHNRVEAQVTPYEDGLGTVHRPGGRQRSQGVQQAGGAGDGGAGKDRKIHNWLWPCGQVPIRVQVAQNLHAGSVLDVQAAGVLAAHAHAGRRRWVSPPLCEAGCQCICCLFR